MLKQYGTVLSRGFIACFLGLVFFTLCQSGCGRGDIPELAPVTGTILLDGKPFVNASVQFYPAKGGRPGTGNTDAEGKYEITYLHGVKGAHLGTNRVEVSFVWPDGEPTPGVIDPVGSKYGNTSTLTADVKDGDNVFDFSLESLKPAGK